MARYPRASVRGRTVRKRKQLGMAWWLIGVGVLWIVSIMGFWQRPAVALAGQSSLGQASLEPPPAAAVSFSPGAAPSYVGPGFTGEWHSSDRTVHLRARSYVPTEGRFLQRDPLDTGQLAVAAPAGANRYLYANANPVINIDPSGHQARPVRNEGARVEMQRLNISDADRGNALDAMRKILLNNQTSCQECAESAGDALQRMVNLAQDSGTNFNALNLGSAGFNERFQDGTNSQGNHFLTGVGIFWQYGVNLVTVSCVVAHETIGDIRRNGEAIPLNKPVQCLLSEDSDIKAFDEARQFAPGERRRVELLRRILPYGYNDGAGRSWADLELSLSSLRMVDVAQNAAATVCDLINFIDQELGP